MTRDRSARFLLLCAVAAAAACKPPPPPPAAPGPPRAQLASSYPITLDRAKFAGSESCKGCHAAEHAAWLKSPHGRATLLPTPATVLGDFAAKPLDIDGGQVSFAREGDRFFMELRKSSGAAERRPVDLVLGSGRQHQDYFTREVDPRTGAERWLMLPAVWSTPHGPWISSEFYQGGSLNEGAPHFWRKRSMVEMGCVNCHVSQGGYQLADGVTQVTWKETPVNCESCHGPAAEHVAKKSAGQPGGELRDLNNASPSEESRTCGVCHGDRNAHRASTDANGWPWFEAGTLRHTRLRVDGTQELTAYQFSGHVLSQCFAGGGLRCVSCHAPHTALPRSLEGDSAVGKESDKQCTACHRNYLDAKAALAHGHHQPAVRCIDCHMSQSWIGDTSEHHQATADHTISIPRPAESIAFGTPDACITCHAHEKKTPEWALARLRAWGDQKALGVRPWVEAIALGRKRAPEAGQALAAVLADPKSGQYLRESALDLIEAQAADVKLAPVLESWTRDPDPWVRALALRALLHHDPADARQTWERGVDDPDGLVRVSVLPFASLPGELTPARLEQDLRDELDWSQRPVAPDLTNIARAFAAVGQPQRALEVIDLVIASSTPAEQEDLHLLPLRARLQQAAISGAAPR